MTKPAQPEELVMLIQDALGARVVM
jgi:hypothetical protein